MAVLKPFSALRFDFEKAGPPETLCCPPYDVISDPGAWLSQNPYNVIRLEGGGRLGGADPYAAAGLALKDWLARGILKEDEVPAFYLYECTFPSCQTGGERVLTGLAGHIELRPFSDGVVLPHENTLSAAKADRRGLMAATGCHISPIYCLYDDPGRHVAELLKNAKNSAPECDFRMEDGIRHALWVLRNGALIEAITKAFADKTIFIADGHHRYETSLRMHEENPGAVSPYVMTVLCDMSDPGLEVHATHRIVSGVAGYDEEDLYRRLEKDFVPAPGDAPSEGVPAWVTKKAIYKLLPRREGSYPLDVTLLHEGILEPLLGIDPRCMAAGECLSYTRDAAEAVARVRSGQAQCAFLMAPPTVAQIRGTMLRGEKMPQKSTYFYPKIITGLFMNRFGK